MIEPTQVLLFAVVVTLTILMVIIGWQIFHILFEIRKVLKRVNIMVGDVSAAANKVGNSLSNIQGFTEGLRAVTGVVKFLKSKDKYTKEDVDRD